MDATELPPATTDHKRELLAALLRERAAAANCSAAFPLSPPQQGMWLQQQLVPDNTAYNLPLAFCLRGSLPDALPTISAVLRAVVQRHPSLRTVFGATDGEPWQRVVEPLQFEVAWEELDTGDACDWRAEVARLGHALSSQAFDLTRGPLFRFQLLRVGPELHVLLAAFHHIVLDGWSIGVFLRDFAKTYLNLRYDRKLEFDPLPIDYSAHVARLRAAAARETSRAGIEHWLRRLDDAPASLELPIEFARPSRNDFRGACHAFELPAGMANGLTELGRRQGATLFMVALASFYALLARLSQQNDIVVGVSTSGRDQRDCRNMIGLFSDVLPMRAGIDLDAGFVGLLQHVRGNCLADYEHADVSLTTIIANLRLPRLPDRNPLFQVGFDFQNTPWPSIVGDAIELINGDAGSAKLDLNFSLSIDRGVLRGVFEYNTHLFSAAAIARIERCYRRLLDGMLARPDRAIGRIALGEAPAIADTAHESADSVLPALAEQTRRRAGAVALEGRGRRITYAELERLADSLAAELQARGIAKSDRVGLHFHREPGFVIALLAVLKAGAVYVPIDTSLPPLRRDLICRDAGMRLVLTSAPCLRHWHAQDVPTLVIDALVDAGRSPATPTLAADDPAYIVYTSGTSGEPKGVVVGHGALAAFATSVRSVFGIEVDDRVQQFAPIGFDTSAEEIYPALLAGATLVFPDADAPGSVQGLLARFEADRISVLNLPTSLWQECVRTLEGEPDLNLPDRVRLLIIGGEAASLASVASWQRLAGDRPRLLNTYGPTETTVSVTAEELGTVEWLERRVAVPIGRPYPGASVHVLDAYGEPVPVGLYGEIYIGGPSVALGYHDRPEETARAFVPDRFSRRPGARLYRTGDFGRVLESGSIEYRGRRDAQVKLRGFRIELPDVEAALMAHPAVFQAAAAVAGNEVGSPARLVAVVVIPGESSPSTVAQLKAWLAERLPAYMVPAQIEAVERLPMTANGKLDRKAIVRMLANTAPGVAGATGAATPEQAALLDIWRDVLGVQSVGVCDDFFELGGHSLLLMRTLSAVQRTLGVDIPFGKAFAATTVEAMARLVRALRDGDAHGEARPIPRLPRVAAPAEQTFRQSHAQQRLWFLHLLDPRSSAYNNQSVLRVIGRLDIERLYDSLQALVRRHEILRTVFRDDEDGPRQVVLADMAPGFKGGDVRGLEASALDALVEADARAPFDLRKGPLLRVSTIRTGDDEHVLVFNWHHIVTDAWSLQLFVRELGTLYAQGPDAPLPPLAVQYADYAESETSAEATAEAERALAYWRERLAALPAPLHGGQPVRPGGIPAGRLAILIDAATAEALRTVARDGGASLFMVCLAAYKLLLGRVAARNDVVVGSPISLRGHQSLEPVLGYFVNTLVLRTDLASASTFRQLLARVRDTALGAFAHRDVPYEQVVRALQAGPGIGPLFDSAFVFENASELPGGLGGGRLEALPRGSQEAKFPLTLALREDLRGLVGEWEYNPAHYGHAEFAALGRAYVHLLEQIAADPDAALSSLDLVPESQLQAMAAWGQGETLPVPLGSLDEAFEQQARLQPQAPALVFEGVETSYVTLNARANRLAHCLQERGVGPDVTVGLCLPRSTELAVAILAVWKAGGAYVPLDPDNPPARRRAMLEDARASCVIGTAALLDGLPAEQPLPLDAAWLQAELAAAPTDDPRRDGPTPATRLAYVLFTSGSSGRPKGVRIEHGSVMNLAVGLDAALAQIGVAGAVRWAWNASYGFDASLQALVQWRHGACLHLLPGELRRDPARLRAHLAEQAIEVLDATPRQIEALLDVGGPALPALVIGGEAIDAQLWARIAEHRALNVYGPTETTVDATYARIEGTAPRIGRPLANVQCRVQDAAGREQPEGVPGELVIGGPGVARGYAGRDAETAERFVTLAGRDGRWYRSGDRVRWCADGMLEYLGRLDGQVKINGYRIEPEEVAQALRAEPDVGAAAVIASAGPGGMRLVGYVVAAAATHGDAAWTDQLLARLRTRLPAYMVPAVLVPMDQLPTTANGKLDAAALPAPALADRAAYRPPSDDVECALARIWAGLLETDGAGIGLDTDILALGAHSMLMVRLSVAIRTAFGTDLALRELFEASRLGAMAAAIRETQAAAAADEENMEEVQW